MPECIAAESSIQFHFGIVLMWPEFGGSRIGFGTGTMVIVQAESTRAIFIALTFVN